MKKLLRNPGVDMSYPILLTLTTGRSGTTYLYQVGVRYYSREASFEHEALSHREAMLRRLFRCYDSSLQNEALRDPKIGAFFENLKSMSKKHPVLIFGNSMSHLAPVFVSLFGESVRFLLLHRNPMSVTASAYIMSRPAWWANIPDFKEDPKGNKLTPLDPNVVFNSVAQRWDNMSRFDKTLYQTVEKTNYCFEAISRFGSNQHLVLSSEEMFKHPDFVKQIFRFAGLPDKNIDLQNVPRNNTWLRRREQKPLRNEWKTYQNHPELFELNEKYLHYDLSQDRVKETVKKYQLPSGIMPWIRHKTRYWDARASVTTALRKARVLPPPRVDHGVDPDAR